MRVLVTGAGGFVGPEVCAALEVAGHRVTAVTRRMDFRRFGLASEVISVGEIGPETNWVPTLSGIEAVVHLAGRAHVLRETAADTVAVFRAVNVGGTESLIRTASAVGVKRLVYVSSIGVNGRSTGERAFSEEDAPVPHSAYAQSKWEAEKLIQAAGLEYVIVRPPLIYGPRVPGNFLRLLRWVAAGRPLPLGCAENRRSLLGVRNFASLLAQAVDAPEAANQLFLAADEQSISTANLVRHLATALRVRLHLIPIPTRVIQLATRAVGRAELFEQLFGSLEIDSSKARRLLGWRPSVAFEDELKRIASWFATPTHA